MKAKNTKWIGVLFCALWVSQCLAQAPDPARQVESRTGHKLGGKRTALAIPEGVSLDDGLREEEAVALALWNNPGLQAEMATLGVAHADVIHAGLLSNPQLTLIVPFSTRVFESLVQWPFEALWQRPRRVRAARIEEDRVSETLVARALDLVRDVRMAWAEVALAKRRLAIASAAVRERTEIAVITNARFRAGDISELETGTARIDARLAEEQALRFAQEAGTARERLRMLLGFAGTDPEFEIDLSNRGIRAVASAAPAIDPSQALDLLIKQALEARPEVRAAELAIEAAGARAKWERSRILTVSAIAKEYGRNGTPRKFEQGPGVLIDLPIFNRNQGNISRAEAEIERALRQSIAVQQRVSAEVREAYVQLAQAREAHDLWRTRLLAPIEQDIRQAEAAHKAGDVPYLFVLETARRLTDARLREPEYQASEERARAMLERSIGRRLLANQ